MGSMNGTSKGVDQDGLVMPVGTTTTWKDINS